MAKKKQKFDYFDAYQELTKLAVKEAELLVETFDHYEKAESLPPVLEKMHDYEHAGDLINHDIFSQAATDFMPPIDREDIVELAHALDNVLDYIEDVLTHMYMYDVSSMPDNARKFADIMLKGVKALDKTMEDFRNFKKSKKFKQLIVDINTYEEEADVLYREAVRHLHTAENGELGGWDVMHMMVWSRTYQRMEKCCDAVEHAADIIATILLKNM